MPGFSPADGNTFSPAFISSFALHARETPSLPSDFCCGDKSSFQSICSVCESAFGITLAFILKIRYTDKSCELQINKLIFRLQIFLQKQIVHLNSLKRIRLYFKHFTDVYLTLIIESSFYYQCGVDVNAKNCCLTLYELQISTLQ